MRTGMLAREYLNKRLPLMVMKSAAGFYLGTADEEGPASRESQEYWATAQEAQQALDSGLGDSMTWTQRATP